MPEQEPPVEETDSKDTEEGAESSSKEIGGPRGREPTRYGDWEKNGRCIDF